MPIYIEETDTEKRLESLAQKQAVKSNKKALARAILRKVSQMPAPDFNRWLHGDAIQPQHITQPNIS